MSLTTAEKIRTRYHLGYPTVLVVSSMAFGIPQTSNTQWMLEDAMERIPDEAKPKHLEILRVLDEIECKMIRSTDELFAKHVGDLEPNLGQADDLEREYIRWASRLADTMAVMPYPYSKRFNDALTGGGRAGNMTVRR